MNLRGWLWVVCVAALSPACAQSASPSQVPLGGVLPAVPDAPPAIFVGAGDIGHCGSDGPARTAALLDSIDGTVFAAGDNAYPSGTADDYAQCYDPSWGRHRSRTRPAPGNHDYESPGAAPYFAYFGDRAGPAGLGYYSFDLGAWHVVSLNSNIAADAGSAQIAWLKADLAATTAVCTLAYWHHPVFSTGAHGNDSKMLPALRELYSARADIVIAGHDHDYERFAPQTPDGVFDPTHGIRSFVVGTGGHSDLRAFTTSNALSDARDASTWGVLKLTLRAASYDWEFVPVAGGTFRDSGTAACVR